MTKIIVSHGIDIIAYLENCITEKVLTITEKSLDKQTEV